MLLVVSLCEEWDERHPKNRMSAAPLAPIPAPVRLGKNKTSTQPQHNMRRPARRLLKRLVFHSELDHAASRSTMPTKDACTSFKPLFAPASPVSFEKRT
jgi:hypothetical protein